MKYTNYKVMMLDSANNRYETISNCNYSKKEAEDWIKLYDPNNEKTLKIISERKDLNDYSKEDQRYIKKKLNEVRV